MASIYFLYDLTVSIPNVPALLDSIHTNIIPRIEYILYTYTCKPFFS